MEAWSLSIRLVEKVVTTRKVYELQRKEEEFLQISDKMGALGGMGVVSAEGVRCGHGNLMLFVGRLWGGQRLQPEERHTLSN